MEISIEKTPLADLVIIRHQVARDDRGFFHEVFRDDELYINRVANRPPLL